jgi:hypothetical protein
MHGPGHWIGLFVAILLIGGVVVGIWKLLDALRIQLVDRLR